MCEQCVFECSGRAKYKELESSLRQAERERDAFRSVAVNHRVAHGTDTHSACLAVDAEAAKLLSAPSGKEGKGT